MSGKTVGWGPIGEGPEDKYHREAFALSSYADGTYELMGPKVQGNKSKWVAHGLILHGAVDIEAPPKPEFDAICAWLDQNSIEGIVWHHPDGRMAKIKRRDFGFRW